MTNLHNFMDGDGNLVFIGSEAVSIDGIEHDGGLIKAKGVRRGIDYYTCAESDIQILYGYKYQPSHQCQYCQNTSGKTDSRGGCISCGAPLK